MENSPVRRVIRILLIDDDENDRRFTSRCLSSALEDLDITEAEDGKDGLVKLARENFDIVLLDLRMPGVDGFDCLKSIKSDPDLSSNYVVVFSTSDDKADIRRALALHANAYVLKPHTTAGYKKFAHSLSDFWFDTALK